MKTYLIYLAWTVGGYFAIGLLVALFFFAVTSYGEGRITFQASDIGTYAYMVLIWPAYFAFAVVMWLSSR